MLAFQLVQVMVKGGAAYIHFVLQVIQIQRGISQAQPKGQKADPVLFCKEYPVYLVKLCQGGRVPGIQVITLAVFGYNPDVRMV